MHYTTQRDKRELYELFTHQDAAAMQQQEEEGMCKWVHAHALHSWQVLGRGLSYKLLTSPMVIVPV